MDTRVVGPRDLAHTVGTVFQDPESQFVTDSVEDEIVFAMENLGVPPTTMRSRVDEVIDLLDIGHLRDRTVTTLSGGERQKVAIAAALVMQPEVLILDEPTSQLDPQAADSVLNAIERLKYNRGLTIILAEHRLNRILPHVDQIVSIQPGRFEYGAPAEMSFGLDVAPPTPNAGLTRPLFIPHNLSNGRNEQNTSEITNVPPLVQAIDLSFNYGEKPALSSISFAGQTGEVIAIVGHNGAGKTTLLKQIIGLLRPETGKVTVTGQDIAGSSVQEIAQTVGYVPQNPTSILHQETLRAELEFTARAKSRSIDPMGILKQLGLGNYIDSHPLDLSGGERQRAALAAIACTEPSVLLLDEPTRGLSYQDKQRLATFVRDYASKERLVIMATHDTDLVSAAADRVMTLDHGRLVTELTSPTKTSPATTLIRQR